jgi:hypothetical protein
MYGGGVLHTGFWEKFEVKRPFLSPCSIWNDNIKMELKELGWGAWTGLMWLRIRTGSRLT